MRNYEITFIVNPVLSGDEIKATAQKYVDFLKEKECSIVHLDEMGLRQLAYPIKRKNSGIYYCVEFQAANGTMIAPIELAMRRDEEILRFLTVSLDKYGVKYNEDKRNGLIGKRKVEEEAAEEAAKDEPKRSSKPRATLKTMSKPAPKKVVAPVAKKAEEEE